MSRRQVLRASLAGALGGVVVAWLLHVAILNTPVQIPPHRLLWQIVLLAIGGGLAGLALSSVSLLKASNPEPDYHHKRRRHGS